MALSNKISNWIGPPEGPRLYAVHQDAVEPPPIFWSVLGAIAWIASRDLRLVAAVEAHQDRWKDFVGITARVMWRSYLHADLEHYHLGDQKPDGNFRNALSELLTCLSEDALVASGVSRKRDKRVCIPALAFADANEVYSSVDGLCLLRRYQRLRLYRADVLRLWPPGTIGKSAIKFARSRAAAEVEALRWLLVQFADEATKSRSKGSFEKEAVDQISGLSSRAFGRAWAAAVLHHPERATAGRKSAGRNPERISGRSRALTPDSG